MILVREISLIFREYENVLIKLLTKIIRVTKRQKCFCLLKFMKHRPNITLIP